MKTVTIEKNDAGQRLDKFLTKTFRNLPVSMMYKYIRQKDIKLNGKRCDISTRLQPGDVLTLYVKEEFLTETAPVYDFLTASRQLDIVYEDAHLLLLNKKAGLLVHPDDREFRDTLIARVQRYLYEKGEYDPAAENSFAPALVNRIDRNTCGIVIAAKTAAALRILNDKLKNREIEKYYLCIVHGILKKKRIPSWAIWKRMKNAIRSPFWTPPLADAGRAPVPSPPVTECWRNGKGCPCWKSSFSPDAPIKSGRILASIGHPLLGDGKYGSNALNRGTGFNRQALCSYKLRFAFQTPAEELAYLNGREFSIGDVWFVEEFRKGRIHGKT